MKKRSKYSTAAVLFLIVIAVLGLQYMSTKNTTFREMVLDKLSMPEISSIEMIRSSDTVNENKITVTDPSEMKKIIKAFSEIKLRKSSLSNINFAESYWITIKTDDNRKFGLTLYDDHYLDVFEYNAATPKNTTTSYKITNKFDSMAIRGLFQ